MRFILGIIFIFVVVWVLLAFNVDRSENPPIEETNSSVGEYFGERMTTRAIESVGQPIEGFDADLLLQAYPGLTPQDFDGVETFEGRYEIQANGELLFTRTEGEVVTSAERTISKEGYATLLANIADRLNVPIATVGDMDMLLNRIDASEQIQVRIDQGGSVPGVTIVPLEVLEDSRCPVDVECIRAGTVRLHARIEGALGSEEQIFELNEPVRTETEVITLTQVSPAPVSGTTILPTEYSFRFQVERR